MAEGLSRYNRKEAAQYRAHTTRLGESTTANTQAEIPSVEYTTRDLRRLGLVAEGNYGDVHRVSMTTHGESRTVDVTPKLTMTSKGDIRTYFYPNQILRSRMGR